jgi:hypothetical protein
VKRVLITIVLALVMCSPVSATTVFWYVLPDNRIAVAVDINENTGRMPIHGRVRLYKENGREFVIHGRYNAEALYEILKEVVFGVEVPE